VAWVIENQGEGKELVVKVASPKHSVYIFNCHGCVVQVRDLLVVPAELQAMCLSG